jgi:hypothetical protein
MDSSLSGTLTLVDGSTTVISKTLALTLASLTEGFHFKRYRVADSGSESITIPATTGRILALFCTGGPITALVGAVSEPIAQDGFLIQQAAFTSLTLINQSGANADVEVILMGDDSA